MRGRKINGEHRDEKKTKARDGGMEETLEGLASKWISSKREVV